MEIDRERDNLTLTDISLTIITPSFKNFIGEFFQTNLLSRFYPKGSIRFVLHDMISWKTFVKVVNIYTVHVYTETGSLHI